MSSITDTTDWQLNKSLPECLLYMLHHEIMCDITFRIGSERRLRKAHKFVLCSRSPVFYIMIEGSLPETGEIEVPDIDFETFEILLEYIYSDNVDIPKDKVGKVLYASEKYMLPKLKESCKKLLQHLAHSVDAPIVLQTAFSFNMADLLEDSLRYLLQVPKQCLNSEDALELSIDCIGMLLQSDELMLSEEEIFTFVLQWATYQCMKNGKEITDQVIRDTLGDLLYLVRFPSMEQDFFTNVVSTRDILTKDELLSVYRSFNGIQSEIFSEEKRKDPEACRVLRYGSISTTGSWISSETDGLTITASKPVFIKSIIAFGTKTATACMTVGIEIRNNIGNILSIVQKDVSLGYSETFDIPLPKPVQIVPNVQYTIISKGVSRNVYYGDYCNCSVTLQDITFTFGESSQNKTATSPAFGQIAGFSFHN